jgi:hypothetical protein
MTAAADPREQFRAAAEALKASHAALLAPLPPSPSPEDVHAAELIEEAQRRLQGERVSAAQLAMDVKPR